MTDHKLQKDDHRKKRFTDKQTDERNHEHLQNEEDDNISEKDIENVKTDDSVTRVNDGEEILIVSTGQLTEEQKNEEAEMDKEAEEEKEVKDNSDPGIETPWNILGS